MEGHGPFFWGGGVFHTTFFVPATAARATLVCVTVKVVGGGWGVGETELKWPIFCIYYKTLTINIKAIPKLHQKTRNRFFHKTPFFQIATVQYLDFWFTVPLKIYTNCTSQWLKSSHRVYIFKYIGFLPNHRKQVWYLKLHMNFLESYNGHTSIT